MGKSGAGPCSAMSELLLARSRSRLRLGSNSSTRSSVSRRSWRGSRSSKSVGGRTTASSSSLDDKLGAAATYERYTGSVSKRVQAISLDSRAATFKQLPEAAVALCKTLVALGKRDEELNMRDSASVSHSELSGIVKLCDVITRGVLDSCEDRDAPHEGLDALGYLARKAKEAAEALADGTKKRFSLSKLSWESASSDDGVIMEIRLELMEFASAYGLATTGNDYVSLVVFRLCTFHLPACCFSSIRTRPADMTHCARGKLLSEFFTHDYLKFLWHHDLHRQRAFYLPSSSIVLCSFCFEGLVP